MKNENSQQNISITYGIKLCEESLLKNQAGAKTTLRVMAAIWGILGLCIIIIYVSLYANNQISNAMLLERAASMNSDTMKTLAGHETAFQEVSKLVLYFVYAALVILTVAGISFYRFFLQEIAKHELLRLAFLRNAVAYANTSEKYKDFIMLNMAQGSFESAAPTAKQRGSNAGDTGHPLVDTLSSLLNKLTENKTIGRTK